ncbi:MAG: adenosylcobinamide-phosphate synthase CbiB [Halobacteriales archaeon]
MPPVSAAAVALAFVLDAAVGEVPEPVHPVAWYGSALARLDRPWARPRLVGGLAAVGLPLAAGAVAAGVTAAGSRLHPWVGAVVAGAVLFSTTSRRMLLDVARDVVDLSERALPAARDRLSALAGREAAELPAGEVRSAAVESAAENLADGLVAPLAAFAVFAWSLPLAAGAAAVVKAVNTGDSMLGYRSKPVGWAFARLDDAVMWLPARLTALVIAAAALDPRAFWRASRWARTPSSPNAGWPMATLAAALDVRLEKPDAYALNPGAPLPTAADARRGVAIVGHGGLIAFAAAVVVAWQ